MMNRKLFLSATVAAAAFALAGCASQRGSSASAPAGASSAASNEVVYVATLAASEEVPPNSSQGRGTAEVRVNTTTNQVRWTTNWSGLTGAATMAHIHGPAAKGANAGVVVPMAGVTGQAGSAQGNGTLTQAQYGDLAAGLYYVNIHTAQNPGGEIRGQLMRR